MAIIEASVTVEEIKQYQQIRTPDYALLANLLNKAKGPERAMAQFAEDTQIGASTLSRIVNLNIKKPLSIDTIVAIYEARANKEDTYLLESLARANGLFPGDYAERVKSRHDFAARRNEEVNRERMMKNALIAGVVACGIQVKGIVDNPRLRQEKIPMLYPIRYGDFMLDLCSESNITIIKEWAFYLFPRLRNRQDEERVRSVRSEIHMIMEKISVWFLLDAWEPDEVKGMKVSFVFVDEELFEGMKETLQRAKLHNEMSLILMDADDYRVIKEVWIPGDYEQLSNISVFEIPAPHYNDDYMNNDMYTDEDEEW